MIRDRVFSTDATKDGGFRWRSHEPSRLEGFSDAVLAFAVTLLVVSLEVPKTFDELLVMMGGFFAFAVSFTILVLIWHAQYTWFRRYALNDGATTMLTMLLLFVVLFFVYPLKFVSLFTYEWVRAGHAPLVALADGRSVPMIESKEQFHQMIAIYGGGYGTIFGVFALMYRHAWRKRQTLELTDAEEVATRFSAYEHLLHAGVGLLAVVLALVVQTDWALFAFFIIPLLYWGHSHFLRRARRSLEPVLVHPASVDLP